MRLKAEKIEAVLQGRMTPSELAAASRLSTKEVGFAISVLVQEGKVRRINLDPHNYYPVAYEKCARR